LSGAFAQRSGAQNRANAPLEDVGGGWLGEGMSVPEIGRSKDVRGEIGVRAADPFPRDEDGEDEITAQVTYPPGGRARDRLEASA
jgi:hypothetical protein